MSNTINYEQVAKELALKVANLEFQVESYKNLAVQCERDHSNNSAQETRGPTPVPYTEGEGSDE